MLFKEINVIIFTFNLIILAKNMVPVLLVFKVFHS